MTEENNSRILVPASIVVAGVIVAAAVVYVGGLGKSPGGGNTATPTGGGPAGGQEVSADDDASLGDPSAPVTIIEFADFQCPYCGRFFSGTEPRIIAEYVKTGKARFVYRDFAFLGQESEDAAVAAECAKEQGKFWEYHDYLFSHQRGESQGAFSKPNLKGFAQALGLNVAQFDSCLDSDKYLEEVRKDTEQGRQAGVSGTPTTFINGKAVVGALPFDQFQSVIEAALAGKR